MTALTLLLAMTGNTVADWTPLAQFGKYADCSAALRAGDWPQYDGVMCREFTWDQERR